LRSLIILSQALLDFCTKYCRDEHSVAPFDFSLKAQEECRNHFFLYFKHSAFRWEERKLSEKL